MASNIPLGTAVSIGLAAARLDILPKIRPTPTGIRCKALQCKQGRSGRNMWGTLILSDFQPQRAPIGVRLERYRATPSAYASSSESAILFQV